MEFWRPALISSSSELYNRVNVAIASEKIKVYNANRDERLCSVVKAIRKRHGRSTVVACAGTEAATLREVLAKAVGAAACPPKFTHALHLTDRNVSAVPVKAVAHHSPLNDEVEILLRETRCESQLYRIQYMLFSDVPQRVHKTYRQKAKKRKLANETTLSTVIHDADGKDISEEVVHSGLIEGCSIESREIFCHARVSPAHAEHFIHVAGPGSSLEDVCCSLKCANTLHVVLSAGEQTSAVEDLPPRRFRAQSGFLKALCDLRES